MDNFSLDFLNEDFALNEVARNEKTVRVAQKDRCPDASFMGMRVWASGAVYPSAKLVETFFLEYPKAVVTQKPKMLKGNEPALDTAGQPIMEKEYDTEGAKAFGFDVIDSKAWGKQYPQDRPRILCVGVTPKVEAKVDLFKRVDYSDAGNPVTSVMDQGAATFGKKQPIPLLQEVYGITIPEKGYVDLEVKTGFNLSQLSSTKKFYLPKVISRGDSVGSPDYVTREGIDIFPLVPVVAAEQNNEPPQGASVNTMAGVAEVIAE